MEHPYWNLDRAQLLSLFDVIQALPNTSAKTCSLKQNGDSVVFVSSNREYFVQAEVPITNTENRLEYDGEVHFSFPMLRFLVEDTPEFSLVLRNGQFFFVGDGFQVKVDTYSLSPLLVTLDTPVKPPTTPFFPKFFLDSIQFFFSRTSNTMENKVLVDGLSASCAFAEFVARVEQEPFSFEETPVSSFGRFYLRRSDVPVLQAFRVLSKGNARFSYYKADKRLWANYGTYWLSFLVLPEQGSQTPEEVAFSRIQDKTPLILSVPRTRSALKTLSFLKIQNASLFSKDGLIRVASAQAQFIVGKGDIGEFSANVDRVSGFLGFIPPSEHGNAVFHRAKNSLVIEFKHQGVSVCFSVVNDASQSKATAKPSGAPRQVQPLTGTMGQELASLTEKKA